MRISDWVQTCALPILFGGTAEYAALWFKQAGIESDFYWYVTGMAVIALLAVIWMPDSRRHGHLGGDHPVESGRRPDRILSRSEERRVGQAGVRTCRSWG